MEETKKTANEIQAALAMPFAAEDLEWRIQMAFEGSMQGIAVPYVTNRAIQNRLDEVVGPQNWYNEYQPWHGTGKREAQICGISIYFEGRGFITKWDGAEDSDIEPVKGGLSDSMKRAAVQWGIGRVLYNMDTVFVGIEKKEGELRLFDQQIVSLEENKKYLGDEAYATFKQQLLSTDASKQISKEDFQTQLDGIIIPAVQKEAQESVERTEAVSKHAASMNELLKNNIALKVMQEKNSFLEFKLNSEADAKLQERAEFNPQVKQLRDEGRWQAPDFTRQQEVTQMLNEDERRREKIAQIR